MTNALGRGAALVAAMMAVFTLMFTGSAFAGGGHDGGNGCKVGEALGNGATVLNSFQFNVCQRSANIMDVSGYFQAMATPPGNVLVAPKGPVTCADIKGKDASFYYPFGAGSMPPPNPAFTGIIIIVHDGGPNGMGDTIAADPVLLGANSNCSLSDPIVMTASHTALPLISGDIVVTEHSVEMCDPKTGKPKST